MKVYRRQHQKILLLLITFYLHIQSNFTFPIIPPFLLFNSLLSGTSFHSSSILTVTPTVSHSATLLRILHTISNSKLILSFYGSYVLLSTFQLPLFLFLLLEFELQKIQRNPGQWPFQQLTCSKYLDLSKP